MTLPPDVAIMLDAATRRYFDELPYSQKRRYLEPIIQARKPETREYRVADAVGMIRRARGG